MLTVIDMLALALLRAGAHALNARVFEPVDDGRVKVRSSSQAADAALAARCCVFVCGAMWKVGRA